MSWLRQNPDEWLRDLERRAAAGDQEAAAQLAAHQRRMLGTASIAAEAEPVKRVIERAYTRAVNHLRSHGPYGAGWYVLESGVFAAMLRKILRAARIPATVRVVSPRRRRHQPGLGNFDVWVVITPSVYLTAEERAATHAALRAAFPGCFYPDPAAHITIRAVDYYDPRPHIERGTLECRIAEPLAGMLSEEVFRYAVGKERLKKTKRNPDERMRRLERQAALGDQSAADQLRAMQARATPLKPTEVFPAVVTGDVVRFTLGKIASRRVHTRKVEEAAHLDWGDISTGVLRFETPPGGYMRNYGARVTFKAAGKAVGSPVKWLEVVKKNPDERMRRLQRRARAGDKDAARQLEALVARTPTRRPKPITLYELLATAVNLDPSIDDSYISVALAELWGAEHASDVYYRRGQLHLEGREADSIIDVFKLAGRWRHPDPEDAFIRSWFVVDPKRTPVDYRDAMEFMRLLNLKRWQNPPVKRNTDERMRDLERRASLGDHEARAQLEAMRLRTGAGLIDFPLVSSSDLDQQLERYYRRLRPEIPDRRPALYADYPPPRALTWVARASEIEPDKYVPGEIPLSRVLDPGSPMPPGLLIHGAPWGYTLVPEEGVDPLFVQAALDARNEWAIPLALAGGDAPGAWGFRYLSHLREGGVLPPRPARNPDEPIRELERRAALGDREAAARLDAMLLRTGQRELRRMYLLDLAGQVFADVAGEDPAKPWSGLWIDCAIHAEGVRAVMKQLGLGKAVSVTTPRHAWARSVTLKSTRKAPSAFAKKKKSGEPGTTYDNFTPEETIAIYDAFGMLSPQDVEFFRRPGARGMRDIDIHPNAREDRSVGDPSSPRLREDLWEAYKSGVRKALAKRGPATEKNVMQNSDLRRRELERRASLGDPEARARLEEEGRRHAYAVLVEVRERLSRMPVKSREAWLNNVAGPRSRQAVDMILSGQLEPGMEPVYQRLLTAATTLLSTPEQPPAREERALLTYEPCEALPAGALSAEEVAQTQICAHCKKPFILDAARGIKGGVMVVNVGPQQYEYYHGYPGRRGGSRTCYAQAMGEFGVS